MLLAMLATVAVAQGFPEVWDDFPAVDPGFCGLWKSDEGQVVAWWTPRNMQFYNGVNHYVVSKIYRVPDGRFRGLSLSGERLEFAQNVTATKLRSAGKIPADSHELSSLDGRSKAFYDWYWGGEVRRETGASREEMIPLQDYPSLGSVIGASRVNQAYLRFANPNSVGAIERVSMEFMDRTATSMKTWNLGYLAPLGALRVDGRFADSQVAMSVTSDPSLPGFLPFSGSLQTGGQAFSIRGRMFGARGTFTALDPRTGVMNLKGYLEWAPTPAHGLTLKKGQPCTTDRLVVWFVTKGFPNGKAATLLAPK